MCGKFTQMMSWGSYVELADLIGAPAGPAETITPMRDATVIRLHNGKRETKRMRWGFVPARAKDPMAGPRHIHARSEDIELKPTFRDAFFDRRGLVVVSTFNEGEEVSPGKRKVQHTITPNGGKPVAIAVIWEPWGERHGGELLTFAMVMVPANTLISAATDRMPAIILPEDWAKWLGEEPASVDELKAMLRPFQGDWDMQEEGARRKRPRPSPTDEPTLF